MQKRKVYATHLTLPTGQRIYISGRTKEELNERVLRKKIEMNVGVDVADNTTFNQYARTWVSAYKAPPKLRPTSYAALMGNLNAHVLPFFGEMKLKNVKPLHIQLFLSSISHLSHSTQSKCLHIVAGIFRTAEDNGLIVKSPVRSGAKAGGEMAKEEEALTNEQSEQLLRATYGTRAYPFCLLALSTGLRRGELLGLMWEDIDLEHGFLTVTHSKVFPSDKTDVPVTTLLKSDAAHRRIPLPRPV